MEQVRKELSEAERERQKVEWSCTLDEWERSDAERDRDLPSDAFNIEALGPRYIGTLLEAASVLDDARSGRGLKDRSVGSELERLLGKNLKEMVSRDPARALELFFALADQDNAHGREAALDYIAKPFARKYGEDLDTDVRRQFLQKWVSLLEDSDEFVREAASQSLEVALQPEWIDNDESAAILDDGLINGWR